MDFGLYLDGGEAGEILLPLKYASRDMKPGDKIEVFIYRDSEDRLIATTETPFAQVGEFAFLKVKATNNVGAFLDWGLAKDLLVPFREQKVRMQPNRYYTVYVFLDDETQRIVASAKLQKFLDNKIPNVKAGDEVKARIYQETDLGYKVIVNDLFSGLIYHNQIYCNVNIGEVHYATVRTVRHDGKIDLILGKSTRNRVTDLADDILDYTSNENQLGKTVGKDKEQSKLTFVSLYGIEGAKEMASFYYEQAKSALDGISNNEFLIELLNYVKDRKN